MLKFFESIRSGAPTTLSSYWHNDTHAKSNEAASIATQPEVFDVDEDDS
jgi:hypothetical protein